MTSTSTTTTITSHRTTNESGKSALQWLCEEIAVCFYLWTFGLSLWSWIFAGILMVYVPWLRLPLLMCVWGALHTVES